jgi:hypothetical protein
LLEVSSLRKTAKARKWRGNSDTRFAQIAFTYNIRILTENLPVVNVVKNPVDFGFVVVVGIQ